MKKKNYFQILLVFSFFTLSFTLLGNTVIDIDNLPELDNLDFNLKQSANMTEVFEWNQIWDNESSGFDLGIAFDSFNNIYVAGYTADEDEKINILKYNASGSLQFHIAWPTNQLELGTGVAIDSQDNIYFIAGNFNDTSSDYNLTLVKYNSSGYHQWNISWGGLSYEVAWDLAIDNSDNIYVVGNTWGYSNDLLIVKFNSAGDYLWNKTVGGTIPETGVDIVYDSSNNFYIIGTVSNYNQGTDNMFLFCFDQNGNYQWNTTWGNSLNIRGSGIALNSLNELFTVGTFNNTNSGNMDVIMVCFDNNGNYKWNKTWATLESEVGNSITIDSKDNIYITGVIANYTSQDADLLLLNYNNSGDYILDRIITGPPETAGINIKADTSDNIYVAGIIGNYSLNGYDIFLGKVNPEIFPESTPDENGKKIFGFDLILFLSIFFICSTVTIRKLRKSINK
ncbi:MAG: SBBP repeat-containing protein [Promethearchaeota archaeon]